MPMRKQVGTKTLERQWISRAEWAELTPGQKLRRSMAGYRVKGEKKPATFGDRLRALQMQRFKK